MNKICIYLFAYIGSLLSFTLQAQNRSLFYHTIERGQTVYAIATMYGVTVEDVYKLNPDSRQGIKAGATLKIPQQTQATATTGSAQQYIFHTIQPKETLYAVSKQYGVPGTTIMQENPGLSVETFMIGRTIRIPLLKAEETIEQDMQQESTTANEIEYTIQRSETMYRLCKKFNITSAELIKRNPSLKAGVKAGMVIYIPVTAEEKAVYQTPDLQLSENEINALLRETKRIEHVGQIKLALLLPFMTEESKPTAETKRFIEYYEGLLLAIDSMRTEGCSIDLTVYDTGSGTKKLNAILKEPSLAEANLIIGAVHNEQISPIAHFAQQNKIKYVIPFTSKNDDVLSNASVFQVNTPHSHLYDKAAQAGRDLFAADNIIFLKMNGDKEKTEFIEAFQAELNEHNIPFNTLSYNEETLIDEVTVLLKPDVRNVVIPTSGTSETLNKIKSPLRGIAETTPEFQLTLFGYPEWQTYTRDCLDDFHALNTYIYTNFYADNLSVEVSRFFHKYKNWYSKTLINSYPKYGILGFDTGMFFLQAIRRYGNHFEDHLDQVGYKGIQTSFDFRRVNNWGGFINTNIFIVHYQNDYIITRSEVK